MKMTIDELRDLLCDKKVSYLAFSDKSKEGVEGYATISSFIVSKDEFHIVLDFEYDKQEVKMTDMELEDFLKGEVHIINHIENEDGEVAKWTENIKLLNEDETNTSNVI